MQSTSSSVVITNHESRHGIISAVFKKHPNRSAWPNEPSILAQHGRILAVHYLLQMRQVLARTGVQMVQNRGGGVVRCLNGSGEVYGSGKCSDERV